MTAFWLNRCEVGTNHWIQCNDTPVKFARFPVTGLVEGRSYIFRVRAVNKCGMSHPSRVSEPVAAMDPADRARMRGTVAVTVCLVKRSLLTGRIRNTSCSDWLINEESSSGTSAPWTGQIIVTEEEPAGEIYNPEAP